MNQPVKEIFTAAQEFYDLVCDHLGTERGTHLETAISATSRIAGSTLMRTFNLPSVETLEPGSILLSEIANEKGPELVGLLIAVLADGGINFDLEERLESVPEGHQPHLSLLEIQMRLEPTFRELMRKYALDASQLAKAGAIAAGMFIIDGREILNPQIGARIAFEGFVEGCKTVPIRLTNSAAEHKVQRQERLMRLWRRLFGGQP